ncbi:T9SS type A sorting domain-containing protein [Algibacter sp. AS12]|uniref:T9SS type A sorting domain-containing protein n=1 Tax=Algibacter sp. AS12 TaxID=3135773 RepID=UPI00398AEBD9
MNNYFYKLLLACLFTSFIYAQQVTNTEFKTKTLQVYQNLDKNRVPHGILLDFGMEFTNLKAFDGTLADSTYTNSQTISDIYKTLIMCRVRQVNTGFITPEEYATRWFTQREKDVMTLSGLYFKYSHFNDNAHPTKINYSNNQFSDKYINGVWQNPYAEKDVFAIAPAVGVHKGLDFNVKLPANLFLSNTPSNIQSIQINFGDGLGYRTVTYGQLLNVSYTQANTYTWTYKINLTNGQHILSHSKIQVEEGLNAFPLGGSPQLRGTASRGLNGLDDYFKTSITATVPYANHYGSATVYIRYANGGSTIRKPLIVAEGFDTGVLLNPEQEAGDNNIDDFLENAAFSNSALVAEMDTYDVIYVDWNNGVDFLQRNAYVLEEVIKWVNDNKITTTQNVVLGQSMGGLIARYALRDIEVNRSFNHDTRLYVSHDAPHLGANTPISVQLAGRHLRNQYITAPIPLIAGEVLLPIAYNLAEGFSDIINVFGADTSVPPVITPLRAFSIADVAAARQMQYSWIANNYTIDNSIHNAWINEYSQMGYPQGYSGQSIRNIAIANGSECGIEQVVNTNIISYIKTAGKSTVLSGFIDLLGAAIGGVFLRSDIIGTALIPGKSKWEINFQCRYMEHLNENKTIYRGSIKYKKEVLYFIPVSITLFSKNIPQPTSVLPYDVYGGGSQLAAVTQVPLSGIVSNSFGIIPTASSLDIGSSAVTLNDTDFRKSYVGATPPAAPKNTTFDNFVTHFDLFNANNNNSAHISFNRRNGNWLEAELVGTNIEFSDCSFRCNNAEISGLDTLCTYRTYSVTSGLTFYNWSITEGNSLVTMTGNGTPNITLTKNGSSSGFVTMEVSLGDGGDVCGDAVLTKRIFVGTPSVNIVRTYEYCEGKYHYITFEANSNDPDASINWSYFPIAGANFYPNGNTLNVELPKFYQSNSFELFVTITNSCGSKGSFYDEPIKKCGTFTNQPPYSARISPNPASSEINILTTIVSEDESSKKSKDEINLNYEIYDVYGYKLYSKQHKGKSVNIGTENLKEGFYILMLSDGEEKVTKSFIIKH